MRPSEENLLAIVIDRLGAGMLGPYGNTANETEAFNRLAGDSWLAEYCLTTSVELSAWYRSVWRGLHPLSPDAAGQSQVERWNDAGRTTLLITDDADIGALPDAKAFTERIVLDLPQMETSAQHAGETQFGQLLGAAIERLPALPAKFVLWLHARGMEGPWDAPLALREHLRDENDPPAASFVTPLSLRLSAHHDPDDLLPIAQAYAAQVLAIDECLEALIDELKERGMLATTRIVLTSPRGCLLGQQGYVGPAHNALLSDLLHVPLIVRYPDARYACERELSLYEPRDLHRLLAADDPPAAPLRDRVCIEVSNERALRTIAWAWRHVRDDATGGSRDELYAKPDDRHEANDVASRAQHVVEDLAAVADATAAAIRADAEATLAPLAEELIDTWR